MEPVVLIKLSNGLDIIGRVTVRCENGDLGLSKVRTMQYQQIGQEIRIGFLHFLLAAEDADITIAHRHVLCEVAAPPKIMEGYTQAVSPIQLATAMPRGRVIDGSLN